MVGPVELTDDEVAAITERMCTRKRRWSRAGARVVAQRMRTQGRRVSPYRCPVCSEWHVGHVPSMATVATIAALIRRRAYPPKETPG